jgi:hypothetical protein
VRAIVVILFGCIGISAEHGWLQQTPNRDCSILSSIGSANRPGTGGWRCLFTLKYLA